VPEWSDFFTLDNRPIPAHIVRAVSAHIGRQNLASRTLASLWKRDHRHEHQV